MKYQRFVLLLFLGVSLITLLILASGLPDLHFKPGKPLNLIDWLFASLDSGNAVGLSETSRLTPRASLFPGLGEMMLNTLIVLFWVMIIFSILFFIISPQYRRELMRMLGWIIFLVLVLPRIAEKMAQEPPTGESEVAGGYALGEASIPQPPAFVENPPEWLFMALNIVLLIILLGGAFVLWRRFRPKSDARAVVVREVRQAISNLESGLELRDVVIACYAKMCQGLQDSQKIRRHQAMTPREFEAHLSNAGITSAHIGELTRLFEGVRYGANSSDSATENEARICLQSILEAYGD
jgi:hypothetical protein